MQTAALKVQNRSQQKQFPCSHMSTGCFPPAASSTREHQVCLWLTEHALDMCGCWDQGRTIIPLTCTLLGHSQRCWPDVQNPRNWTLQPHSAENRAHCPHSILIPSFPLQWLSFSAKLGAWFIPYARQVWPIHAIPPGDRISPFGVEVTTRLHSISSWQLIWFYPSDKLSLCLFFHD